MPLAVRLTRVLRCLALLVTPLAATSRAGAQTVAPRGGETGAARAAAPRRAPFFRVTTPDGRVFHLLGSMHVMKPDVYPLPEQVERAFQASDAVVFEIDEDSARAQAPALAHLVMNGDGRTLSQLVTPATDSLLHTRLPALGLQPARVQPLKPWFLATQLSVAAYQRLGFTPEHGIDRHFFRQAREQGKPVLALESVAFQLGLLDAMDATEQDAMLRTVLAEYDRMPEISARMDAAWRAADIAALDSITNASLSTFPRVRAALLGDRNRRWIAQLPSLLANRRSLFVVVGAGHLAGTDGLVALLGAQGYTVTPL